MRRSGEHEGHNVHPHDHRAQPLNRVDWCSGKWLCLTCATHPDGPLPKGVWFTGPKCPRPR